VPPVLPSGITMIAMLREANYGRHTAEILAIADTLRGDQDDMVQKVLGWLLKATYPEDAA
jgi:3-methyladenine DNA glycosylase AlkD